MLAAAFFLLASTASAPVDTQATPARAAEAGVVEWRGRAVCVDEAGRLEECATQGRRYAFRSPEGHLHPFALDDPLAPVFDDPRVRGQEIAVRVRPRGDGGADLIKVYSVKHGKRHDVRYFCETCNVTSFVPGACPCCRAEMELRETPAE